MSYLAPLCHETYRQLHDIHEFPIHSMFLGIFQYLHHEKITENLHGIVLKANIYIDGKLLKLDVYVFDR